MARNSHEASVKETQPFVGATTFSLAENASDGSVCGCEQRLVGSRQLDAIRILADGSLDERPVLSDTESTCNVDGSAELFDESFVAVESAHGLVDPDILMNTAVSIRSLNRTAALCNESLRRIWDSGKSFHHQRYEATGSNREIALRCCTPRRVVGPRPRKGQK